MLKKFIRHYWNEAFRQFELENSANWLVDKLLSSAWFALQNQGTNKDFWRRYEKIISIIIYYNLISFDGFSRVRHCKKKKYEDHIKWNWLILREEFNRNSKSINLYHWFLTFSTGKILYQILKTTIYCSLLNSFIVTPYIFLLPMLGFFKNRLKTNFLANKISLTFIYSFIFSFLWITPLILFYF